MSRSASFYSARIPIGGPRRWCVALRGVGALLGECVLYSKAGALRQASWKKFGYGPPQDSCGHVGPNSIYGQHLNALRDSSVCPFVLYSLRHTLLTRLGESGCDSWTLDRIAGHSSVAISACDVHPNETQSVSAKICAGRRTARNRCTAKVLAVTERCWSGRTGLPAKSYRSKNHHLHGVRWNATDCYKCFAHEDLWREVSTPWHSVGFGGGHKIGHTANWAARRVSLCRPTGSTLHARVSPFSS
jgi:hypothetical protein